MEGKARPEKPCPLGPFPRPMCVSLIVGPFLIAVGFRSGTLKDGLAERREDTGWSLRQWRRAWGLLVQKRGGCKVQPMMRGTQVPSFSISQRHAHLSEIPGSLVQGEECHGGSGGSGASVTAQ